MTWITDKHEKIKNLKSYVTEPGQWNYSQNEHELLERWFFLPVVNKSIYVSSSFMPLGINCVV